MVDFLHEFLNVLVVVVDVVVHVVDAVGVFHNACALPVPCSHRFFFFSFLVFFSFSSWVAFFVGSWAPPRRFWSPTWPQLGSILEPCWSNFGASLGVVLASQFKTVLRSDFDRFFIDFPPLGGTKNIEKHKVF